MKKNLAIGAGVALIAALLFLAQSRKTTTALAPSAAPDASAVVSSSGGGKAASNASTSAATAKNAAPFSAQATGPAPQAGQLNVDQGPPAKLPPETALQNVGRAVQEYGAMFNGNPVGTNPEITSQLGGNNPKHANFINPQAGMQVNGNGELVDQWGTPYFFHQLSGTEMEIHSAGPDKVMWTGDDLVVK